MRPDGRLYRSLTYGDPARVLAAHRDVEEDHGVGGGLGPGAGLRLGQHGHVVPGAGRHGDVQGGLGHLRHLVQGGHPAVRWPSATVHG